MPSRGPNAQRTLTRQPWARGLSAGVGARRTSALSREAEVLAHPPLLADGPESDMRLTHLPAPVPERCVPRTRHARHLEQIGDVVTVVDLVEKCPLPGLDVHAGDEHIFRCVGIGPLPSIAARDARGPGVARPRSFR